MSAGSAGRATEARRRRESSGWWLRSCELLQKVVGRQLSAALREAHVRLMAVAAAHQVGMALDRDAPVLLLAAMTGDGALLRGQLGVGQLDDDIDVRRDQRQAVGVVAHQADDVLVRVDQE